jgi:alpha-D-ribose 1-methylphosphonate 5-triphosphate synthase subunit PhnH
VSVPTTIQRYDPIYDAQRHFRTLLDCTARPGTIGLLENVGVDVPTGIRRASALIALTLFGADTTFCILPEPSPKTSAFFRESTAATEAPFSEADFLILLDDGLVDGHAARLEHIRLGTLVFPDTAATVILQVEAISPAPMSNSLRLRLTGPGIESETVVFVSGVAESFLSLRRELNSEFPLGFDLFLACDSLSAGPCILSLPRTTSVAWERIEQ